MIAKITRGSNPGNIGAYLHGPGHANEHFYERNGGRFPGGVVVGGNVFVTGDADEKAWVKEMRAAMRTRPEITKPIWQASLRNTVEDRRLTDAEWAQAGQSFAESMGFAEHPWVMVRHADDHVHVVVWRVSARARCGTVATTGVRPRARAPAWSWSTVCRPRRDAVRRAAVNARWPRCASNRSNRRRWRRPAARSGSRSASSWSSTTRHPGNSPRSLSSNSG